MHTLHTASNQLSFPEKHVSKAVSRDEFHSSAWQGKELRKFVFIGAKEKESAAGTR